MKSAPSFLIIAVMVSLLSGLFWLNRQTAVHADETTTWHKVVAPPNVVQPDGRTILLLQDYGSFQLFHIAQTTLESLPSTQQSQLTNADEMDWLLFDAHPFNTQTESLTLPESLTTAQVTGSALHLVQFIGPIKAEWLAELEAIGVIPIQYIANNGYMVWADDNGRAQLDHLRQTSDFLQFSLPHQPYFKLGPALRDRLSKPSNPDEIIPITIQIYDHPGKEATLSQIHDLALDQLSPWSSVLAFQNSTVTIQARDVETIARLPDVVWLNEWFPPELLDEVQGQILAANFDGTQSGPSGPGYLPWLNSYGFSTNPADYPIVDIVDDGIGTGAVNSGDRTLHELGNIANPTRLAYVSNCTNSANGAGPDGHGHINISIAGGYDTMGGFPFHDPLGFQRGLGINPYGRFAGTRIFDPSGFDISTCGGTDAGLIRSSQDDGAQITSNSWGCAGCAGSYDTSSQAFDVGVRDADLTEAGNQQMIMVFSAGNSGPGTATIGTPGNGKNMITVGASENDRPSDEDGLWTDGCGISSTGANHAMDVIGFSSRGPSPGGRIKPEVIAPGTHIQGTASTHPAYNGTGVCDQFRPSGQTTFAASSGTSHSAPAVAGVTSLYYYWLQNEYGLTPSPALMKAYLIAHPTYLTGVGANDTLPSNSQGYGMPNLAVAFDDTTREFINQSVIFDNSGETWTWTGSVADPTRPVRIVLVYTDQAGPTGVSPQVNNLNLTAVVNGNTYLGNRFSGPWSITGGTADNANNYEAVFLPAGTTGPMNITVTAFNIAGDGVPNSGDTTDQDFALVCYNCSTTPDFTVTAVPTTQSVCAPSDAPYTINVGQINGFNTAVTLSIPALPAGLTSNISVNNTPPPYSSALTIGNTGAAMPGSYTFDVVGTAVTIVHTTTLGLNIAAGIPTTPTLLAPANGATNIGLTPTLVWTAVPGTTSYTIQIDDDPGFGSVNYTAVTTAASHTVGTPLTAGTTYYWRIQASNGCGNSAFSPVFSFQTGIQVCTTYNSTDTPIPLIDPGTINSTLIIGDSGTIQDMNVLVNTAHTWVGDLTFTVTHLGTSTAVTIIDRPGVPASTYGCANNNILATLDDEAALPVENQCAPTTPTINGTFIPNNALAAFDGENSSGTWRMTVNDAIAPDTGTLNSWALVICAVPDPGGTAVWDGGGITNDWSEATNWVGDVVPQATDTVLFDTTSTKDALLDAIFPGTVANIIINGGYTGTITMDRSFIVTGDYTQVDGIFVVSDPATAVMTVSGNMTHTGGVLRQTQTVNSTAVPFLQIEDGAATVKYRGATLDATPNSSNLGAVTVNIRAVDRVTQFCTNTGAMSGPYAGRCFDVTPTITGTAMLRLYALTSELPGGMFDPAVYHDTTDSGDWVRLTINATTGTIGTYTYAEAEATGFSPFLIGDVIESPTAVTLTNLSSADNNTVLLTAVFMLFLLMLTGIFLWSQRQVK